MSKTLKELTDDETLKGNFIKLERYLIIDALQVKEKGKSPQELSDILPVDVEGIVLKPGVKKVKNGKNVIEYEKSKMKIKKG